MLIPLIVFCGVMCLLTFWLFASDKRRARNHKRRIPEKSLIAMSLLGGGLGGWIAMKLFRHKTLHTSFRILVPVGTVLWAMILALVCAVETFGIDFLTF